MKSFRKAVMILVMATMAANTGLQADARRLWQAKGDPQTVAKLAQILERSGYTYKKAADNVWVANFKGDSLTDIHVIVTSAEGLIVMGVVVAEKSAMQVTPEMMRKNFLAAYDERWATDGDMSLVKVLDEGLARG